MKPRFLFIFFAFLMAILTGCATQQSMLRPANSYEAKAPASSLIFDSTRGLAKVKYRIVLRAGEYVPVGQDDLGVWYLGGRDNLLTIFLDSPKERKDGNLFVGVYTGGVFIPHNRMEKSQIFLIPASERFWTSKTQEYVNNAGDAAFVDLIISQNIANSPAPVASAVGGAIGGAIIAYDAQGFKASPIVQPDNAEIIRAWVDVR